MKTNATLSRQRFLQKTALGLSGLLLTKTMAYGADQQEKPAQLPPDLLKGFVGVSHSKLDRVQELLKNNHLLLHASYDWGGGDFESGIEAAGHVGNKEIAMCLLSKGARYNVCLACMLGHLDTVKHVLTFNAGLLNSKGPHGFTMLHHAMKGATEAKLVADFLQSLGAKEQRMDFYLKA
ncbi:MAG: ankyrin repeat domain-containing protein [Bacteroidota bacterium]